MIIIIVSVGIFIILFGSEVDFLTKYLELILVLIFNQVDIVSVFGM